MLWLSQPVAISPKRLALILLNFPLRPSPRRLPDLETRAPPHYVDRAIGCCLSLALSVLVQLRASSYTPIDPASLALFLAY